MDSYTVNRITMILFDSIAPETEEEEVLKLVFDLALAGNILYNILLDARLNFDFVNSKTLEYIIFAYSVAERERYRDLNKNKPIQ